MSETTNSTSDTCGCCKGLTPLTPQSSANLPGLSSLSYRVGTHSRFKATMLTNLTERRGLGQLTSRDNNDPSIALLDASAVMLDVLTFYQERIINEGFLRTAVERRSILELAREIGYELAPGVAAGTYLAFFLETAAGAPGKATIPRGTRVQSLPGQDEKPQSFETVEAISAQAAWNEMKPKTTELVLPGFMEDEIYLKGVSTNLKVGDALLIVGRERLRDPGNENWDFRRIKSIQSVNATYPDDSYTLVNLEYGLGSFTPYKMPAKDDPRVFALRQRANLFGYNAPDWKGLTEKVRQDYLKMIGSNAAATIPDWPDLTIGDVSSVPSGAIDRIYLDLAYPQVRPGGWAVLSSGDYEEVYQVKEAVEDARACLMMSGKSTRLVLDGENLRRKFNKLLRQTVVFCRSEELEWAEKPILRPLRGDTLTLCEPVTGLLAKRILIVSGRRCRMKGDKQGFQLHQSDGSHIKVEDGENVILTKVPAPLVTGSLRWTVQKSDGRIGTIDAAESRFAFLASQASDETVSEVVTIKAVTLNADTTAIELEQPLAYYYDLATISIYGNVALATHGETKKEVLGSGNASRSFQKFVLKNAPLTYVSAANVTGSESTLEVRVDDILWKEVDSFYDLDDGQRAYITRLDDDGNATIEFGDGLTGSRPPTGDENISAVYRVGTGADGMVKSGQLSLLMSRILGVQKVTNPLAPSGAADPESRDDSRRNAPFTVMTLGRVVSLQDFEDFARAFAGIGKAQTEWLWDGEARVVHLTIASSTSSGGDYRVAATSTLYKNLRAGIDAARDTTQRLLLDTYAPLSFRLKARLLVNPDHSPDKVVNAVKSALKEAYQFSKRLFGQSVSRGEVLALIQGIEGVDAAFLDALHLSGQDATQSDLLISRRARWEGSQVRPAELLLIDTAGISVEAISS